MLGVLLVGKDGAYAQCSQDLILLPVHSSIAASDQVVVVNQGPVEMNSSEWVRVDEAADSFFARVAPALGLSNVD